MKKLAFFAICLFVSLPPASAQSATDSTEYPSFRENYNAHAAFINGSRWTTSLGNRPLGRGWKNVSDAFTVSPEGQAAHQLALFQRKRMPLYVITGLALTVVSLPLLMSSHTFDLQKGIALGLLGGGLVLSAAANNKIRESADNFEKALWLRNRDALLESVPPTYQPRFKYLYETETIYLATRAYMKNGHKRRLGFLAGQAAKEFEGIPGAWDQYKKYRNQQRAGILAYAVGLGAMLAAPAYSSGRSGSGQLLYLGGVVIAGAGAGIMASSRPFLSQAIYLRNYTVLDRKMIQDRP